MIRTQCRSSTNLGLRLLALPCHAFSPFSTRFKMMISLDQAIQCLETELGRPESGKKRSDASDRLPDLSVSATPALYNSYSSMLILIHRIFVHPK